MLPTVLAEQLQIGLSEYIKTTFPMTNAPFRDSLDAITGASGSVCLEPYLSLRLPFRPASGAHDCSDLPPAASHQHGHRPLHRADGGFHVGSDLLLPRQRGRANRPAFHAFHRDGRRLYLQDGILRNQRLVAHLPAEAGRGRRRLCDARRSGSRERGGGAG